MNDIWNNVTVDEELREFIILSPKDINDLTREAMRQANPAQWLSDALNGRGLEKKMQTEVHNNRRMAQDLAFFRDFNRWPGIADDGDRSCAVKEQPWIKANGRRYGFAYESDFAAGRWIIHPEGEKPEMFASLEELVKIWSVD